ncbi:MAG TPA: YdjY domain-containing protein, partial [Planctomycetaceae bacterium]|nr:YdjY domain-containing protein [Planctomycetaceae bacterium]
GGILVRRPNTCFTSLAILGAVTCLAVPLRAADPGKTAAAGSPVGKPADGLVSLNPNGTVLLDREGKRLLVKTHIVLREGVLEMLCCPAQTKEHESILAVDSRAYVIHAGLLALGAKPGTPVQYRPEFKPPTGQPIDIFLQWSDAQGKRHRVKAQEWIRYGTHRMFVAPFEKLPVGLILPERNDDLPIRYFAKFKELTWFGPMSAAQRDKLLPLSPDAAYQKAIRTFFAQGQSRQLDAGWVFVGSGYYVDEKTGEKSYLAEGGDLICVSNFPTAMLDLSVKSTDKQDEGLLFEPWTERVPPRGTEVTMELVPVFDKPVAK